MALLQISNNHQKGQMLIEILIVIAISAIMLPALLTGLFSSTQGKAQQGQRVQAIALMKEAEEVVVKAFKDATKQFQKQNITKQIEYLENHGVSPKNEYLLSLRRLISSM